VSVNSSYLLATLQSFGLHIALAVVLVGGVSFTAMDKPKPQVINVEPIESVAIDQNKLNKQIDRIKTEKANKRRAEEKRVADLERRANTAKNKRRSEEDKIKDLNKKTRLSKAEKRKADAAAERARKKQKREAEKAKKLAAEAKIKQREKAAAEKAAADAKARKRKAEEDERIAKAKREAKAKQDKIAREQKAKRERERREAELELQKQMAAEQAAREKAHSKQVLGEVEKFKALITARIKNTVRVDESVFGKECKFTLKLAFNGLVTKFIRRDGDKIVCDAVESAVYQIGQLPVSKDPAVFEELKSIKITFVADPNQ